IIQDTIIYKPHLVYRDTGSCRLLSQKIDTAAILAACLAVNCYRDTLKNDTSALVIIENEVSMNELQRTRMEFLNRQSKFIITNNCFSRQNGEGLMTGVIISPSRDRIDYGVSLMYKGKSKYMSGISYNISHSYLSFSLLYLIKP
ncbi:MAG: hypothetical protein NTU44_13270, partial [Bacteroidetes bacterium]|nr:hypothetical protein [Bacteroidota bacterium]